MLTLILKEYSYNFSYVFVHVFQQFVHGCRYTAEVVNIYCLLSAYRLRVARVAFRRISKTGFVFTLVVRFSV